MLSYAGVSGYTRATGGKGPCFKPDRKSIGGGDIGSIGHNVGGRGGGGHGGKAVARIALGGVFSAEGDSCDGRNGAAAAFHIHRTNSSRDGSDHGGVVSQVPEASASGGSSSASERSDDTDGSEEGKRFDGHESDTRREKTGGDGPAERSTAGSAMTSKTESVTTCSSTNSGSKPPQLDCLRGR